ncbi:MurR/RpiR family transcriptional regulator [Anaerobium acetethylicum]|uniref:DNA-binding transcriptional regulator, MurR/RpiR family, contains HTH and SIS domains n=1 Tax=Anaerobium acetethylicum TaxID=1619234 RepID=A0A1D3TYD0_9FIRM|nr:MurR/RpiR family transcriptional regulator [Anaerobium acetethylicum]SCP99427.1 DNA-binding transcriptional regulator, MurR/RpiR family, contains HTH and SIS domains [Anaerobium acetethylicum]
MEDSVFSLIRTKYNTLSPTQKNVADYILSNSEKVILLSIGELAQFCDTSETTVIRFLRKLKYDSYQVFRVKIAQELSGETTDSIYEEIGTDDDIADIKRKVIQLTISSINDLNNLLDEKQLAFFTEAIVSGGKAIFIGVGSSGIIAADAYHKFLRLGIDASFSSDSHIMSIACAHARKQDLVVAFSHSGESRDILESVELAKEGGAKIAAITSYPNSSLSKSSDIVLLSSSRETKYRSDAMISRIIQLVIIDTLYVSTVLKLGSEGIKRLHKSRLAVAKKKT